MKKKVLKRMFVLLSVIICALPVQASKQQEPEQKTEKTFEVISGERAWEMMQEDEDSIILDVRKQEEYTQGHIPGALLLPLDELEEMAEEVLKDLDQTILVYCRSGRRSNLAAEILSEKGYTQVYDFGGILDWDYEVVTGDTDFEMESEEESETESAAVECAHVWAEDCTARTCMKCGKYERW